MYFRSDRSIDCGDKYKWCALLMKLSPNMKKNLLTLLTAVGVSAGVNSARAQQDTTKSELLQTVERQGDRSGGRKKPDRPDRPEHSDRQRPDKEVIKQLVDDFQAKAEDYKNKQQDLTRQLKDASNEDRAKIRDEITKLRQDFQETKEQFRNEMKDQIDKVKTDLKRKIQDEKPDRSDQKEHIKG